MPTLAAPTLPERIRQVLFAARDRVELRDVPPPEIGPGDLLLRVARVGICATDLHLLAGHIGDPFPLVPGHEFVGEVAAIGENAAATRGLAVGDRATAEMLLPCGVCPRCREGRYNMCTADDMMTGLARGRQFGVNIPATVAPGLWGGYADYLFVPAGAITHRLPDSIPWDAVALTEPLAVACHAVARGRVTLGDTVVVIGPGPVGILIAAAARAAGAARVIMAGTRDSRLDLATRFGADVVVNSREVDSAAVVRADLGGLADVVIEAAGVAVAQQQAAALTRRGGRVVLAGACGSGMPVTFHQDEDLLLKELDVLPSFLSAGGYEPSIALLARGDFPFADLVTHRFALAEVEHAFDVIRHREGNVVKAVIDPTDGQLA